MIRQDVTPGRWKLKQPEAQSSRMNKILLADNQELFRIGIAEVLPSREDFRVAAQCADLERLLLSIDAYRSSIVLFASALRPEYRDLMAHCLPPTHSLSVPENSRGTLEAI